MEKLIMSDIILDIYILITIGILAGVGFLQMFREGARSKKC
mgnify:FL=1